MKNKNDFNKEKMKKDDRKHLKPVKAQNDKTLNTIYVEAGYMLANQLIGLNRHHFKITYHDTLLHPADTQNHSK